MSSFETNFPFSQFAGEELCSGTSAGFPGPLHAQLRRGAVPDATATVTAAVKHLALAAANIITLVTALGPTHYCFELFLGLSYAYWLTDL